MAEMKNSDNTKCWQRCMKTGSLTGSLAGGDVKWYSHSVKDFDNFFEN